MTVRLFTTIALVATSTYDIAPVTSIGLYSRATLKVTFHFDFHFLFHVYNLAHMTDNEKFCGVFLD
jgi:hypothetical protein